MRAPILTVASGEIPRRRTFIRLVSMGNKIAKLQGSDRSPQEECIFCDIVKGVGRGKIFEVPISMSFDQRLKSRSCLLALMDVIGRSSASKTALRYKNILIQRYCPILALQSF